MNNILNYHVEIFGWWILVMIAVLILCHNGGLLTEKYAPKRWWSDNGYLNDGVEENINTSWLVIFLVLAVISMLPIYPTYFSSPTVQITTDGKIIPITHPVWIWDIPQDSTYVRLEKTYSGCNLWELRGTTNDGIEILGKTGVMGSDIHFQFTNYDTFYGYYKTAGVDGFCKDLQSVAFDTLTAGKIIYPEVEKSIATIEQEHRNLSTRLVEVYKAKFQDKGIVPVLE